MWPQAALGFFDSRHSEDTEMDRFAISDGSVASTVLYVEGVIVDREVKIARLVSQGKGLARATEKLRAEIVQLEALLDRTKAGSGDE